MVSSGHFLNSTQVVPGEWMQIFAQLQSRVPRFLQHFFINHPKRTWDIPNNLDFFNNESTLQGEKFNAIVAIVRTLDARVVCVPRHGIRVHFVGLLVHAAHQLFNLGQIRHNSNAQEYPEWIMLNWENILNLLWSLLLNVPLFVKMMCIETEDHWTYVPNRPATNFDSMRHQKNIVQIVVVYWGSNCTSW